MARHKCTVAGPRVHAVGLPPRQVRCLVRLLRSCLTSLLRSCLASRRSAGRWRHCGKLTGGRCRGLSCIWPPRRSRRFLSVGRPRCNTRWLYRYRTYPRKSGSHNNLPNRDEHHAETAQKSWRMPTP